MATALHLLGRAYPRRSTIRNEPFGAYDTVLICQPDQLTATSYLLLGSLARGGSSTPYQLQRHVAPTLDNFWTFPQTLLYTGPTHLQSLGLVN